MADPIGEDGVTRARTKNADDDGGENGTVPPAKRQRVDDEDGGVASNGSTFATVTRALGAGAAGNASDGDDDDEEREAGGNGSGSGAGGVVRIGKNLKVDGILTHSVDTMLLYMCSDTLAKRFKASDGEGVPITKVLSVETAGLIPGFCVAICLNVPLICARKKPVVCEGKYLTITTYAKRGEQAHLYLSSEYMGPDDNVLIIDGFLASGRTVFALADLVAKCKATVAGVGVLIEKEFAGARQRLNAAGMSVESLVRVTDMDAINNTVTFADSETGRESVAEKTLKRKILSEGIVTTKRKVVRFKAPLPPDHGQAEPPTD